MKIAVIGGGAAGLMTTWLLDDAHEVHLFERHPILGAMFARLAVMSPARDLKKAL